MVRILVPPAVLGSTSLHLTEPKTLHHLQRVLRVRPGETVECFDGAGRAAAGPITRVTSREILVAVERRTEEPPPARELLLVQALIRPERFEWVLEKATELGAARVLPVITSRTTARATRGTVRLERWRRIVEAACAQSGRSRLPTLEAPQPLDAALRALPGCQLLLPTLAEPGLPVEQALAGLERTQPVAILIGPEGDFSPEEVALAKRQAAQVVSLGRLTLRSETAGLVLLTLARYHVGTG
jgi:16S rRNA (uracil1498-N3)-methyltransferase